MTIYTEDIIWANQQTCTYHFHEKSTTNRKHALPRIKYIKFDTHIDLLKLEYERGRRDALWSILEAKREG